MRRRTRGTKANPTTSLRFRASLKAIVEGERPALFILEVRGPFAWRTYGKKTLGVIEGIEFDVTMRAPAVFPK